MPSDFFNASDVPADEEDPDLLHLNLDNITDETARQCNEEAQKSVKSDGVVIDCSERTFVLDLRQAQARTLDPAVPALHQRSVEECRIIGLVQRHAVDGGRMLLPAGRDERC